MTRSSVVTDMLQDLSQALADDSGADPGQGRGADTDASGGGLDRLATTLDRLADLRTAEPPAPTGELARLLGSAGTTYAATEASSAGPADGEDALAAGAAAPARRWRRVVAIAVAALVLLVVGTGVGAAANVLPGPVQRAVAHFSERYLPFRLPRPPADPPATTRREPGSPARDGTGTPSPSPAPASDQPTATPSDAAQSSGGPAGTGSPSAPASPSASSSASPRPRPTARFTRRPSASPTRLPSAPPTRTPTSTPTPTELPTGTPTGVKSHGPSPGGSVTTP